MCLTSLKAACRYEEPIWNWKSGIFRQILKFPYHLMNNAIVCQENKDKLYTYCSIIMHLLLVLHLDVSDYVSRLSLTIERSNSVYLLRMGFPKNWLSSPLWAL